MAVEQLAVRQLELPGAQGGEYIVRIRQIGRRFLNVAAERAEGRKLRTQHRGDARIHRQSTELWAPGDAHALEIARQRLRKPAARLGDGDRALRIPARNRT